MKVSFVAGFGPIVKDPTASRRFWSEGLGIEMKEEAPDYFATGELDGVKYFSLWPLAEAAENTFGTRQWPADIPVPTSGIEFDVESPEAVAEAVAELESKGYRVLRAGSRSRPGCTPRARNQPPKGPPRRTAG